MNENLKLLCFLDVLGFTCIFNRIGLSAIKERYSELTEYVRKQTGGMDIARISDGHVAVGWLVLGNAYFSDTILFWTDYSKIALPSFTLLISETICYSIEHELPLRGTISVGEAILDSATNTYLGTPIIEGAKTEPIQKWIGVSFGSSFLTSDFSGGFHLDTVLPYKSHYKDNASPFATSMVVDWPRRWRETRDNDIRPLVRAMDVNEESSDYYTRTLDFIDFSELNHDWFKENEHLDYG